MADGHGEQARGKEISFRVRVPVPRLPVGLLPNLVGLLGLIAVVAAVGGLTGNWWWSVLVGGVFAVGLAYMAGSEEAVPAEPARPVGVRPVAVAKSA